MHTEVISSRKLSTNDLAKINVFRSQEFGVEISTVPTSQSEDKNNLYFLLKDDAKNILAFSMVEELPLKFRNELVLVLCVSTLIATEKGQGYGRQVLAEIQNYAKEKGRTLLGFCETDMIHYYIKCGFNILSNQDNQFVYVDEKDVVVPNIVPGEVFYISGSDQIIERILVGSDKHVRLQRR